MHRPLPSPQEAARILAAKRSRPPRRPPPTAGKALAKTLKALGERFGHGAEGLKARWSEIVGGALARRIEPVKLIRTRAGAASVLEIRVEGPSAALIAHQAPDILARVNLFLGPGAVGGIRIVQGPLRRGGEAAAPRSARTRSPPPLDAAAERALAESLSALGEGRLKAALARLGREVLRQDAR
ncbi:MAG: DUF721 domain-containing protein [Caulobacteraceae bacterium]